MIDSVAVDEALTRVSNLPLTPPAIPVIVAILLVVLLTFTELVLPKLALSICAPVVDAKSEPNLNAVDPLMLRASAVDDERDVSR